MSRNPQEDLFQESSMSFGEHLEELRVVLVRALLGLVVCCLLGLLVAGQVVKWIQGPLKDALEDHYVTKAEKEHQIDDPALAAIIKRDQLIPESIQLDTAGLVSSLQQAFPEQLGHLEYSRHHYKPGDLKSSELLEVFRDWTKQKSSPDTTGGAVWGVLTEDDQKAVEGWAEKDSLDADELDAARKVANRVLDNSELTDASVFAEKIKADPLKSLYDKREDRQIRGELNRTLLASAYPEKLPAVRLELVQLPVWKPVSIRVQTLNAHEAFMIWLKAGFFSGLILSSPWIFYQIWTFVSVGLYAHERNYVYLYLPLSLILFLAGAGMAFFFVFEHVLNFLFSFNAYMDIDPDPRISEWLSFVLFLPIGFGIAFQLPLVMLFLNRLRIFSIEVYLAKWRIAVLIIFIASMLLTPADPVSMLLMALPLTVLYFFGVMLCRYMPTPRRPDPETAEVA